MSSETKSLTRKATWIDKSLTIRRALRDPRALKAFQGFAASIHASENIQFWIAVEFFRLQHVSTPRTAAVVRKRVSAAFPGAAAEAEATPSLFGSDPRHSILLNKHLTSDVVEGFGLSDPQLGLFKDAVRIFTTYLEDGAPHWTCVDSKSVDEIRQKLKTGTDVDINIFAEPQHQVFTSMQNDMFPRFIRAVLEDPAKYTSEERFELPEDIVRHLRSAASQAEMVRREEGSPNGMRRLNSTLSKGNLFMETVHE